MKILNDDIKLNYLSYELSNTIKEYNLKKDEKVFIKTLNELQKNLPSCSQEDILKVVNIIINLEKEKNNEKSKIVFTGPTSFLLKQTKIWDEVKSMLVHAENSITLTGYSVSDYFDEMQSLIIEKASQCVCIKLYINDFEKHEDVLANLLEVPKEYAIAIEMTLGVSLQNIVVESEEDAKRLVEYLRNNSTEGVSPWNTHMKTPAE